MDIKFNEKNCFYENFKDNELINWNIIEKQWGGDQVNGGTVKENVSIKNNNLHLKCNGDKYKGNICGINRDKTKKSHGYRVGAAIATKKKYGYGKYEVCMKLPQVYGVCSAIWTFYYKEIYNKIEDNTCIINHEIDMEFPGRPNAEKSNISYEWALLNTFIGVEDNEYKTIYKYLEENISDNKFHIFKFEWYEDNEKKPIVKFYIDNKLLSISNKFVPYHKSNFWIGCWFPNDWAGIPNFETDNLIVKWVKITPIL